ncbi:rhodanese-like domain-containing protein [Brockia lithotrophica]|uniref:Rhodanese-related sulfurtransferase n=1 Tax=Brockia lithotrophica TaxID=933949 RepID=A0A660KT06_9BACL|nr:rhodanese-like domain-containing protein [Brockia lithotrophica]RKQ83631.1 rhodanese-related sulfurtransferase [Brockia lithotrophica]
MQVRPWTRRVAFLAATFVLLLLPLAACSGKASETPQTQAPSGSSAVCPPCTCDKDAYLKDKVKELFTFIRSNAGSVGLNAQAVNEHLNDYMIVDLRKPADYEKEHIPGAVNIPFPTNGTPDNDIVAKMDTLPKDKPIVVYCYSGQMGSFTTALLRLEGYDVRNLMGGFPSWLKAGLKTEGTEAGKSAPQSQTPASGGAQTPAPSGGGSSGGGGGCGG